MNSVCFSPVLSFINYFFSYESKPIFDLPNEIWSVVLENLKARELMSCGIVSKRFNSIAIDNRVWKKIVYNETKTRFRDLTELQQSVCVKRIACGCPYILGLESILGPSVILEGKKSLRFPEVKWYEQALIVNCKQRSQATKVVFKVIKASKNQGFAYIEYLGLKPREKFNSRAVLVPIDKRLFEYVERLFNGDLCGILKSKEEDHSACIYLH